MISFKPTLTHPPTVPRSLAVLIEPAPQVPPSHARTQSYWHKNQGRWVHHAETRADGFVWTYLDGVLMETRRA
jgi:hypothetical protein